MTPRTSLLQALPDPLRRPLKKLMHPCRVLYADLERCDLFRQASAMAYTTLLSLVPSLAAAFTLVNLFSPFLGENSQLVNKGRDFILKNLAAGAGEQVIQHLTTFLSNLDLRSIGITSFAGLVVTLVFLLAQIEEALNRIWLVRTQRNLFMRFVYFWTFLTLGVFIGAVAIGYFYKLNLHSLVQFDAVKGAAKVAGGSFLSSLVAWSIGFGFFFLLYKIVPNCQVTVREAAIGALIAGTLFHQGARFYGYFATNFTSYATIYGALAAIPVFLFWLYLCWLIILSGALFAWRSQQGFPKQDEQEITLDTISTPGDWLRNAHLKSALPIFLLLLIYRNFASGSGRGVGFHDLSHRLKLPPMWISDALDALEKVHLIVGTDSERLESDASKVRGNEFFPVFPAEKIKLSQVVNSMSGPAAEWIKEWHHDYPVDLAGFLSQIMSVDPRRRSEMTMADALALAK
jgi:membrane protein